MQNADQNTQVIRQTLAERIANLSEETALKSWRKTLLTMAFDADIVLDLHCDQPSLVHLFIMPQLLPEWMDLADWIGAEATLWAEDSGGGSFDEVFPTPWVQMQRAFPDLPIEIATGAATVELRGREDISDEQGEEDAQNLIGFLAGRGFIEGKAFAKPSPAPIASSLEATTYARVKRPGLLSYVAGLGDEVEAGQVIANLRAMDTAPPERIMITAPISGRILSTNTFKYVRPGDSIAKIVGTEVLESRKGGYLLED